MHIITVGVVVVFVAVVVVVVVVVVVGASLHDNKMLHLVASAIDLFSGN